jgi:hypothetical protein
VHWRREGASKGFQYQVPFLSFSFSSKGESIYGSVGYVPKENVLRSKVNPKCCDFEMHPKKKNSGKEGTNICTY